VRVVHGESIRKVQPGVREGYAHALSRGPCCSNMEMMASVLRLTREEKDGVSDPVDLIMPA